MIIGSIDERYEALQLYDALMDVADGQQVGPCVDMGNRVGRAIVVYDERCHLRGTPIGWIRQLDKG